MQVKQIIMRFFSNTKQWFTIITVPFKRYLKKNMIRFCVVIMLIFPIIVGGMYSEIIPENTPIKAGDLLAYYGVAFGILNSFIYYRIEKKEKEKERNNKLRPAFSVNVEQNKETSLIFKISIKKICDSNLMYMHLYDEFISSYVEKEYCFYVTYNQTIENVKDIDTDYNITMDELIIDTDGYPKYVQIICNDTDNNSWDCCYYKIKDCDKYYYYPRDIDII